MKLFHFPTQLPITGRYMTNIAQNKTTMRKEHHKTEETLFSPNNASFA
jgi:hypothetical protein